MTLRDRVIQGILAMLPLGGVILLFFPGLVGLPTRGVAVLDPPLLRIAIVLFAMLVVGWAAARLTRTSVRSTALLVAGPTLVAGTFLGVFAALRPLHLVITFGLVGIVAGVAFMGVALAKRRHAP